MTNVTPFQQFVKRNGGRPAFREIANPAFTPQTYYRERGNARLEYWTYADGARVCLDAAKAERDIAAGRAKLVDVRA
jgi:hypothetical protein